MSPAPTVLVIGGVGFIGRHVVTYLVENNLASEIRVVDKVLPHTAFLNERQNEAFRKVEKDGSSFDFVFNLAAETKYSMSERFYEERIFLLSTLNAKEAAKRGVKCFVEVSTAEIYQSDKKPSKEDAKIIPWTTIAKYKYRAEEELKKIPGLNLVILRPSIVYGMGATAGLTPRLVCGRVYQHLNEEMRCLWSKDLKINTVHVLDVARAIWHVAVWYRDNEKAGKGPFVYNLSDPGNTDQAKINGLITQIFGVKTGYHGSSIDKLAQHNLDGATDEVNDKHATPWADLTRESGIKATPLSTYVDKELLYNNALSVDGTKIVEETGFTYEVPEVTVEKLQEIIDDFKLNGLWPKDMI
ncbi:6186_t:CDS:2 [Ambispora leptoticha]|uniref:6186_t:CDS:1 n=1 Tax=Ambispora leptoticha TaxID=144679 RepID=A0A9N9FPS2_9GLOM|nr:6186_t:CDS:2 [Ambispora leptoticha]